MRPRTALATLVILAACATKERASDSAAPVDTMKPAPMDSSAMRADTAKPAPGAPAMGSTKSASTAARATTSGKTTTPRPATRDTNLGRDSVIRFPLNDPSRRLPVVKKDTARPPR